MVNAITYGAPSIRTTTSSTSWRIVPITDVHAERDLCLIWRHDSHLPAAVRAFLAVLHEQAPRAQGHET
jgi:DNA-binding transcriptional LysR family regulator